MKKKTGLSEKEIRELILEQLNDREIEHELVDVEVLKGPRVVLDGEISQENIRKAIKQVIRESFNIEDITDKLSITHDLYHNDDEEESEEEDLYDEDKEIIGTEGVCRSVEDGIPYFPPTRAHFRETSRKSMRKRK